MWSMSHSPLFTSLLFLSSSCCSSCSSCPLSVGGNQQSGSSLDPHAGSSGLEPAQLGGRQATTVSIQQSRGAHESHKTSNGSRTRSPPPFFLLWTERNIFRLIQMTFQLKYNWKLVKYMNVTKYMFSTNLSPTSIKTISRNYEKITRMTVAWPFKNKINLQFFVKKNKSFFSLRHACKNVLQKVWRCLKCLKIPD